MAYFETLLAFALFLLIGYIKHCRNGGTGQVGSSTGRDDKVCMSPNINQDSRGLIISSMLQPVPAIASIIRRLTTSVCCCFCDPIVIFSHSCLCFLASHSTSPDHVCGANSRNQSKGPNRIETTSGGGLLNAAYTCSIECTFRVDAQMRIKTNGMCI